MRMPGQIRKTLLLISLFLLCGGADRIAAQQAAAGKTNGSQAVTLDRVVAIVNSDLILESDIEAERRFEAFQPLGSANTPTRDELINRLVDRTLILQQIAIQPEPPIPEADVDSELMELRKTIPKCAAYHCETDAGWQRFVQDQGLTLPELREHWKLRMEVLRFIEERFRMGIRITQQEIDNYYKQTLIPQYEKQSAAAPPVDKIKDKIQQILLQQQVGKLLDDWLSTLRAQGSVRMLKPGEEAP